MKSYHVSIGNGEADKFTRNVMASGIKTAVSRVVAEYEAMRKDAAKNNGARPLRKSLAGEGIRIFIRYN